MQGSGQDLAHWLPLKLTLMAAYCYKPLKGKPQPQQVWGPALTLYPGHSATSTGELWSLWAAMGLPNSRSGVKSLCPTFLGQKGGQRPC